MRNDFRTNFPILAGLRLSEEHCQSLRRGGFVAEERRGSGVRVFKLRFRCGSRQYVRYLGTKPETAEEVRRELDQLQEDVRGDRDLRRWARAARHAVRKAKEASEPLLRQLGFAFHGLAIRRLRRGPIPVPRLTDETLQLFCVRSFHKENENVPGSGKDPSR
jgi:hypothetical protein